MCAAVSVLAAFSSVLLQSQKVPGHTVHLSRLSSPPTARQQRTIHVVVIIKY